MTTQHDQQLGCRLRASRYRRSLAACLALLFWAWAGQSLWAVPNPVIPRLADCGVMHYQGRYYISGTWMGGKMRVSDDLVRWTDPVHVFSMHNDWTDTTNTSDREIHACDITYDNGLFHFYWSVNHFPLRQIGHAFATQPTGPYDEPVTKRWFDGRIDPHLLISETGPRHSRHCRLPSISSTAARPLLAIGLCVALSAIPLCQGNNVAYAPGGHHGQPRCPPLAGGSFTLVAYGSFANSGIGKT